MASGVAAGVAKGVSVKEIATGALAAADSVLLAGQETRTPTVSLGQAGAAAFDAAAAAYQNEGRITGFTWGLEALDNKTLGLQRGEMTILGARPSMGKSAVALSCLMQSAAHGNNVLFFSLEMGATSLAQRALADLLYKEGAEISYQAMARGTLSEAHFERMHKAQAYLDGLPFVIEQQAGMTVSQIAARARNAQRALEKKGQRLDILAVDHLHIVKASDRYRGNKVDETGEVSFALKALAKELDAAALVCTQLNRKSEERIADDRRPKLSDLRYSGDIEQDADVVILLYRESYYLQRELEATPETPDNQSRRSEIFLELARCENEIELIVAKQRNGPIGTVRAFAKMSSNAIRNPNRSPAVWGEF
jgi:replicative DNA helicase